MEAPSDSWNMGGWTDGDDRLFPPNDEHVNHDLPLQLLKRLQIDQSYDIVLFGNSVGDDVVPIKAHKNILSAASEHLRDAFTSVGFLDSDAKEYAIDAIDHVNLQRIVDFVYTGELVLSGDRTVKVAQLKSVLTGADYLVLPELVSTCESALIRNLSGFGNRDVSVYIEIWLFAKQYRCTKLADEAIKIVSLSSASECDAFLELPADSLLLFLNEIRRYENDNGWAADFCLHWAKPNAERLCKAAVAWLDYNKHGTEAKSGFAMKLMCAMPLSSMSTEALTEGSEIEFLGEEVLAMLRHILDERREKDLLRERCGAYEQEIENLKMKLERKSASGSSWRGVSRPPRARPTAGYGNRRGESRRYTDKSVVDKVAVTKKTIFAYQPPPRRFENDDFCSLM